MKFGSLFTGIGGFDLGLERAGMTCAWQVEIDPYCTKVLERHWPNVRRYGDVKTIQWETVEGVDLICGGFPCQPFSVAGKRRGESDNRNLWPEMLRAIKSLRPRWVLGENVPGIGGYLDTIYNDLEAAAYEVISLEIPASAFMAPHLRYRVFIVAYAKHAGLEKCKRDETSGRPRTEPTGSCSQSLHQSSLSIESGTHYWSVEPGVGRMVDGFPYRVDRLKCLGNAIVPQVAEWLGQRVMEVEQHDYANEGN